VNCTTQIQGTKGIVALEGRFTFEAAADFKACAHAALEQPGIAELHLDFKGVSELDPSALGSLLMLREKAETTGARVILMNPNPNVRALLDGVKFAQLFEIRD